MPRCKANLERSALEPAVLRIIKAAARRHGCRVADLLGPSQLDPLPRCRQAIWFVMFEELLWSRAAIARLWQREWKTINVGIQREDQRRHPARSTT